MSHHTRRAQGRYTAFGEVVLRFPYSPGLVDDLKDAIPYRSRSFDPTSKAWTVCPEFADVAIGLLLRYFPNADVPFRSQARETRRPSRGHDPFAVLHLRPTAPRELIDVAYRCLAKMCHPDTGGDPAAMRRLNEAHDALSRRLST